MPTNRSSIAGAFVASLALAACAGTPNPEPSTVLAANQAQAQAEGTGLSVATRDLTAEEKKIIVDAIAPNLKNPGKAKYRWTKFPTVPPSDQVAYCATVDAESPHAAFSGRQAYIVDVKVVGGHITTAVLGLIAGGKDVAIVAGMCKEHGLDPNKAS